MWPAISRIINHRNNSRQGRIQAIDDVLMHHEGQEDVQLSGLQTFKLDLESPVVRDRRQGWVIRSQSRWCA